ncbi:MAG TPA: hypothetical protein VF785_24285 [Gemmatimonadaceae bacterium]
MRPRFSIGLLAVLVLFSRVATAQDRAAESDRMTDGLLPGDYVRLSAGLLSPVNPQGSLRDWDRGTAYNLVWENWQSGPGGVGRIGFGIGVNYGLLPLNQTQFLSEFVTPQGSRATAATASSASLLEIETNVRFRIPAPYIMPNLSLGFGYINFRPSTIQYAAPEGSATTAEQRRYGGEFTIGGGLDKHIVDRFAVFGEATYTYGFTSLGQGLARPGGTCATSSNGCDPLKNTTLGTIRGGLRVRVGG